MSRRRTGGMWAGGVLAFLLVTALAQAQAVDSLQRELDFCSGLVKLRFADYATRILDNLEKADPSTKGRIARVRVETLTSLGKVDEARALIKTFPPDSTDTYGMLLALGDTMYSMNKLNEAKVIYREFFSKFPSGPPNS